MNALFCPLLSLLSFLAGFLNLAILIRVLLSWVDQNPYPDSRWKELLYQVTDPILEPLRRNIPPMGMFDISPIVAFLILGVIVQVVRELQLSSGCIFTFGF